MAGLNKAIVIGRLGLDPKITKFDTGSIGAFISIATSEYYTDKVTGEKREITEWHAVKAWGKLAEIMEKYLKKGSQVCIEGKMKTDKYTDKQGEERYSKYILASNMMMLDSKEKGVDNHQPAEPDYNKREDFDFNSGDEIPF
jgi:single-strand DNA-binding protein